MPILETVKGIITDYDEITGEVTIKAKCNLNSMLARQYETATITFNDSRNRSLKQLRACYAMIGEIAEYVGETKDEMNDILKLRFWTTELAQEADTLFSLSDAPMSIVSGYQKWLARFILRHEIPTRMSLLSYVDDVQDYIYACLINKKCCICGRKTDLHHVDHIGIGRDREEIIHEGLEVLPLCREHHTECHLKGQKTFNELYHLESGIILDKTLCKIYGLKGTK